MDADARRMATHLQSPPVPVDAFNAFVEVLPPWSEDQPAEVVSLLGNLRDHLRMVLVGLPTIRRDHPEYFEDEA
jgi:hypothetical protein